MRNFAIDPTGAYLLAENQDSGTIVVFRINPKTGSLKQVFLWPTRGWEVRRILFFRILEVSHGSASCYRME